MFLKWKKKSCEETGEVLLTEQYKLWHYVGTWLSIRGVQNEQNYYYVIVY